MGGVLSSLSAVELGSIVIKEAFHRANVPAEYVDHIYIYGMRNSGGTWIECCRQAALIAGLPVTTTAQTINIVCGSGLDAVNSTARLIQAGDADIDGAAAVILVLEEKVNELGLKL